MPTPYQKLRQMFAPAGDDYTQGGNEAFYEDPNPDGQGNVSYQDGEADAFYEDPGDTHPAPKPMPRPKVSSVDYGQDSPEYNQPSIPTSAPKMVDKSLDPKSYSITSPSMDLATAMSVAYEKARNGKDVRDLYRNRGFQTDGDQTAQAKMGNIKDPSINANWQMINNMRNDVARGGSQALDTTAAARLKQLFGGENMSNVLTGNTQVEQNLSNQARMDQERNQQREMQKMQIASQQAQQQIANNFRAQQLELQKSFQAGQISAEQARIANEKLKIDAGNTYQTALLDLQKNDPTRQAQTIKNDLMRKFGAGEKISDQQAQMIGVTPEADRQMDRGIKQFQFEEAKRKASGIRSEGEMQKDASAADEYAQSLVNKGMGEDEAANLAAKKFNIDERLLSPKASVNPLATGQTARNLGYKDSADLFKATLDDVVRADPNLRGWAGSRPKDSMDTGLFDTEYANDPDYKRSKMQEIYERLIAKGVPASQAMVIMKEGVRAVQ